MSTGAKVSVTLVLLLVLGGLAAADAMFTGDDITASIPGMQQTSNAGGVAKRSGKPVKDVIRSMDLDTEASNEPTILAAVVKDKAKIESLTILKNNDRIGSITWVESPQVKTFFIALKESLVTAFGDVQDLRDVTLQEPGKPVRNTLSFSDASLGEEPFAFVRVRERLFEFHIMKGKEADMAALLDAVTLQ